MGNTASSYTGVNERRSITTGTSQQLKLDFSQAV
jgi:hypothetical protein